MIDKSLSKKVLTIGCAYNPPKGGIAQVINSYSKLFSPFRYLKTSDPWTGVFHNLIVAIAAWIKFCILCIFGEIKIVHVHGASYRSFWRKRVFILTAKFFRKKIVYHIHAGNFDEFSYNNRKAVNAVMQKVDVVVALTSYWKEFFEHNFNPKKVIIIPNIIDYPKANYTKDNHIVIGVFLGLLNDNKGIYDILAMLNKYQNDLRGKFKLYIGGNGETEKVKKQIKEYAIGDLAIFEGWIGPERKAELLSKGSIYLLPSHHEGLPISILEAMSYKMAIVASGVGGIPEVVHNGENGFLINPGDQESLYKAIQSLIIHPDTRRNMGEHSFDLVQPYLPDKVEKALTTMYEDLLK